MRRVLRVGRRRVLCPDRRRARGRTLRSDETGTIMPLVFGYAVLALALLFVCVDATSLYLAQKRADGVADAAALAGADGFTLVIEGGAPVARLSDEGVREQAAHLVAAIDGDGGDTVLVSATTPDGTSARVTVATTWHPPIVSLFVPDGITLEATATSRTGLH